MAKVVHFNVDEITRDYYEKNPLPVKAEVVFIEKSPSVLSAAEINAVKDADVISVFVHANDVGADVLKRFLSLKLVAVRSTGYNNVDIDYCQKNGIEAVNVPGYGDSTVAEYAFGLMIMATRKIGLAVKEMKTGEVEVDDYLGFDLKGRTLGVVGTGAIGRYAVKIAKGFDMNVIAFDPYPNQENAEKMGFSYVSLDEIYAKSDIITLHCPLTKENRHMLNAAAFEKMKDGVVIVNTARGELIDTEALYRALTAGKVKAAGLDVLEDETSLISDDLYLTSAKERDADDLFRSLINHRLLQLDNVVVTPHIAFDSIDAVHRILETTNRNIASFLQGKTINSVIKKT